jgi:hypothetical protein
MAPDSTRNARSGAAIPWLPAWVGGEPHRHNLPDIRSGDETSPGEHVEVLHHRRQFDRSRFCRLAYRCAVLALEPGEDRPARRVDECGKGPIELLAILCCMVRSLVGMSRLSTPDTIQKQRR